MFVLKSIWKSGTLNGIFSLLGFIKKVNTEVKERK